MNYRRARLSSRNVSALFSVSKNVPLFQNFRRARIRRRSLSCCKQFRILSYFSSFTVARTLIRTPSSSRITAVRQVLPILFRWRLFTPAPRTFIFNWTILQRAGATFRSVPNREIKEESGFFPRSFFPGATLSIVNLFLLLLSAR